MNISLQSIDGFDDFLITGNGFEARAGIAQASRAAARGYQGKGTIIKYISIIFESDIIMFDF